MHRLLMVLGFTVLAAGAAVRAEPDLTETWDDPERDAVAPQTVDELAGLLEERVSLLTAVLGIQSELLSLARRDPDAAFLARPAMSQCLRVLPVLWCNQLTGTFRPESAP